MGSSGVPQTFAATILKLAREELADQRPVDIETAILSVVLLGLLAPLYPAWIALRLITARPRLAALRQWIWVAEGIVVVLLSPIGRLVALWRYRSLSPARPVPCSIFRCGSFPASRRPGGLAAIVLCLGRRSRVAWIILAAPPQAVGG
jgi:hypothetical protein